MEPYRLSHSNWAAPQHVAAFGVAVTECNQPDWGFCSRSNWKSLVFREKKRDEREKIDDERCFISIYTNINVQSFRRRRQRRSHRRSSGRDGAFRAVRFIREYRNLESLWWEEKRDEICDWERRVCIQISKSFHFWLKERLLLTRCCSLFSDESPKREKESLFVREEKTHFTTLSLSLSLCVCVLLPRSSLCVVSARSFSLFSLNLITKERMERKMKRERRRAILPLCLNPTP